MCQAKAVPLASHALAEHVHGSQSMLLNGMQILVCRHWIISSDNARQHSPQLSIGLSCSGPVWRMMPQPHRKLLKLWKLKGLRSRCVTASVLFPHHTFWELMKRYHLSDSEERSTVAQVRMYSHCLPKAHKSTDAHKRYDCIKGSWNCF